jgi:4-amino-4-deoxy-L-arabinose transferase-like glycosyltransferase
LALEDSGMNSPSPAAAATTPRTFLPLYACAAVAIAAYLYLFVRVLWRIGDEGDMLNGALAVAQGRVPYRDFFDLRGPASFYWLGLFFKVFGATWFVARTHLLLTGVVTSLLVYYLTVRASRRWDAALPCVVVTVLSIPFWPAAHHHWDSNLFALAAVAAFCRWQDVGKTRWLLAAGVLAGLTSCFIYQKGFLILAALLAAILASRFWLKVPLRPVRAGALVLAGYVVVGLGVLAWFAHLGALQDFLDATVRFPLQTYVDANRVPYAFHLTWLGLEDLGPFQHLPLPLMAAAGVLLMLPLLLIAALPALVLVSLAAWWITRRRAGPPSVPVVVYSLTGFALWLSEFHRKDMFHLIYGCPILLIALWLLWISLTDRRLPRVLPSAILAVSIAFLAVAHGATAASAHEQIATRRGVIVVPAGDAALRFLLSDSVHPGDYVLVYPYYATYYFLADVRNPTRFGEFMYGPGARPYIDEAIADLDAKRVKYVLWDTLLDGEAMKTWFPAYQVPPEGERPMERYFLEHYDQIAVLNGFRLLERR